MCPVLAILTPPLAAAETFTHASAAVSRLEEIYERNTQFLRDRFEAHANGEALATRVRANYPLVRITTSTHARLDSRLAYGFVARPGVHQINVTRSCRQTPTTRCKSGTDISKPLYTSFIPSHDLCLRSYDLAVARDFYTRG